VENVQRKAESHHPQNYSKYLDERIAKLKEIQRGWINYFRMASMQAKLKELDGWLRN
jgi:RNA-directed DNA polymerase